MTDHPKMPCSQLSVSVTRIHGMSPTHVPHTDIAPWCINSGRFETCSTYRHDAAPASLAAGRMEDGPCSNCVQGLHLSVVSKKSVQTYSMERYYCLSSILYIVVVLESLDISVAVFISTRPLPRLRHSTYLWRS